MISATSAWGSLGFSFFFFFDQPTLKDRCNKKKMQIHANYPSPGDIPKEETSPSDRRIKKGWDYHCEISYATFYAAGGVTPLSICTVNDSG